MAHRRVFAAVVAAALVVAAPAHADEPTGTDTEPLAEARGPMRAELVIEATLGDASTVVVDRVRVRGEALLRKREVLPARDATDPKILIRIEPIGTEPGYRCTFGAYEGDVVIAQSDGVSLCKLCTEAELVDHVEAAIDRVVPKLPADAPPPRATPTPAEGLVGRAPLQPLGKAGIGVAVTGVAATIAGAVLVSRPTKTTDNGLEREQTEFRAPGIAVLSIGIAAMVAGLAMIAVDRHRARRRGGIVAGSPALTVRF